MVTIYKLGARAVLGNSNLGFVIQPELARSSRGTSSQRFLGLLKASVFNSFLPDYSVA